MLKGLLLLRRRLRSRCEGRRRGARGPLCHRPPADARRLPHHKTRSAQLQRMSSTVRGLRGTAKPRRTSYVLLYCIRSQLPSPPRQPMAAVQLRSADKTVSHHRWR